MKKYKVFLWLSISVIAIPIVAMYLLLCYNLIVFLINEQFLTSFHTLISDWMDFYFDMLLFITPTVIPIICFY